MRDDLVMFDFELTKAECRAVSTLVLSTSPKNLD
jgi:hypothetical protein